MSNRPIIDCPGALHYLLRDTFHYLGKYADPLWITFALFFVCALILFSYSEFFFKNKFRASLFIACIAIGIAALRLPTLLFFELNPDESQWIAGASTLIKDPRFWISVNGGTSGPLNIFPLTGLYFIGTTLNYATLRLFGILICIIPSVLLMYGTFRNFFNESIARIAILPLVIFFAFARDTEMIIYTSENIPMLLTALCIFLYSQAATGKRSLKSLLVLAFLIGCMPYAKLQGVPIACCLGIFCLFDLSFKKKLLFVAAALLPTALISIYILRANIFDYFWQSYIVFNLIYAKTGVIEPTLSWNTKIAVFFFCAFNYARDAGTYLFSQALLSALMVLNFVTSKIKISKPNTNLIIFSSAVLASASYGVIKPGNFFEHYQILLLVPAVLFAGTFIGIVLSAKKTTSLLAVILILGVILPAGRSLSYRYHGPIQKIVQQVTSEDHGSLIQIIRRYAKPNETMAVWGYMDRYYVLCALLQGTKDPHSSLQIRDSVQRDYFLKTYAHDLADRKPRIFIDAVARQSFMFNTPDKTHENFPDIKRIVDQDYTFIAQDENGIRAYVRSPNRDTGHLARPDTDTLLEI